MSFDAIMGIVWQLLAVAVLVFLNGFFVAAEFALVKIRDTQLDPLLAKGSWRARMVRQVTSNLDSSLSACQLGITLASLGLGWVGEPIFSALLQPLWPALGVESVKVQHSIAVVVGFPSSPFSTSPPASRRRNGWPFSGLCRWRSGSCIRCGRSIGCRIPSSGC